MSYQAYISHLAKLKAQIYRVQMYSKYSNIYSILLHLFRRIQCTYIICINKHRSSLWLWSLVSLQKSQGHQTLLFHMWFFRYVKSPKVHRVKPSKRNVQIVFLRAPSTAWRGCWTSPAPRCCCPPPSWRGSSSWGPRKARPARSRQKGNIWKWESQDQTPRGRRLPRLSYYQ